MGSAFTYAVVVMAKIIMSPTEFGKFSVILQIIYVSVPISLFGLPLIIFKLSSRKLQKSLLMLKQNVPVFLLISSILSVILFSLVYASHLTPLEGLAVAGVIYVMGIQKLIAQEFYGLGNTFQAQIYEHVARMSPMLIALCISWMVGATTAEITLYTSALCFTISAYFLRNRKQEKFQLHLRIDKPKRLRVHLISGAMVQSATITFMLLSTAEQAIITNLLSLSLYGDYRFCFTMLMGLYLFVDVIGIQCRRKYLNARGQFLRSAEYFGLRQKLLKVGVVGIITGFIGILLAQYDIQYSTLVMIFSMMLFFHGISLCFGDPMFALLSNDRGLEVAHVLLISALPILVVMYGLIENFDLYGAAVANGLTIIAIKFLLYRKAKRHDII